MLLCRVIKPSAVTSAQCLNSVQVRANRVRLLDVNLTCSLRNNTTICSSRVCSGYAYNKPCICSQQAVGGREENPNIFRDSSTVEIGELSHPDRAYISAVAQATFNDAKCSSRLSYPFWVTGNRNKFRLTEFGYFLLSSRAKVRAVWLSTSTLQMRTASSTAAQPKRDTSVEEHTAASPKEDPESSTAPSRGSQGPEREPQPQPQPEDDKPSKTQQLKKVFKEYGAVGVAFHVGISLMSLGIFYGAVSSGFDMAAVLYKMGFSESVVQSKLAAGTSTFVLAYAVHKLFAPVRISITLVCVPLIVRYFRKTGLFKPPASSP